MSDIKNEWRRFSEEKPKEREPVWCADDEGVVGFYYYLPSNSFFETFTHWQSAVKPPPPSKPPPKPAVRESKRGFISAPAIEELKEACKPKPMEWHSSSSKPAVGVTEPLAELLFAIEAALPFVEAEVGTWSCSSSGGPVALKEILTKYDWDRTRWKFVPGGCGPVYSTKPPVEVALEKFKRDKCFASWHPHLDIGFRAGYQARDEEGR